MNSLSPVSKNGSPPRSAANAASTHRAVGPSHRARRLPRLRGIAPARPFRSAGVRLARGLAPRDRLYRARRPDRRSPRAGIIRSQSASHDRRRRGSADPRHNFAAGRPIQTSRDLPAFWAGSWRDVAKEMRGATRHPWPDDPANAPPTLRTKRPALDSSRYFATPRLCPSPAFRDRPQDHAVGKAQTGRWCWSSSASSPSARPLTGWNGSGDTKTQVG